MGDEANRDHATGPEPTRPVEARPAEVPPFDAGGDVADRVADAKRRHGAAGGMLAAGMLGLDQVLNRKPREEVPVVVASNSDPIDIDTDGISVAMGTDAHVVAPPLPRTPPKVSARRRKR